jgi:transcriptional regulator with XRE-family HTH domain
LADAAGISKPYLSQIETGKRIGAAETRSTIEKVLNLSLDELVTKKSKAKSSALQLGLANASAIRASIYSGRSNQVIKTQQLGVNSPSCLDKWSRRD